MANNRDIACGGKICWNRYYFLSFIVLTIFLGTREGVGVDFFSYKNSFESGIDFLGFEQSLELGYVWLIDTLRLFNLDYHSLFFTTSFITILLFFYSFKNECQLLPIGLFLFFMGGMYAFIINGIRQGVALMAFYNILRYIDWDGDAKNKLKNLIWIIIYFAIGALFHYSILLFIPVVLLLNKKILSLFNAQILAAIILLGFAVKSIPFVEELQGVVIEFFPKYSVYTNIVTSFMSEVGNFGFGAVFILIVNLIPILFYNKIKSEFPSSSKYFVLYAFGTSMMYAYSKYLLIGRLLMYMSFCSIYVFAYTYCYLKKHSRQSLICLAANISIITFHVVKFIYVLPGFLTGEILGDKYSFWFITLVK